MTATLYDLSALMQVLNAQIELRADEIAANGGALPNDLAAMLDDAEGKFGDKVENIVVVLREILLDSIKAATERDRLSSRVKSLDARHAALKDYLKRSIEAAGLTRVESALATVTVQPSASIHSSLSSDQLALLCEAYPDLIRVKPVTYELDKKACMDAFKRKRALPNNVSVVHNTHLVIA